MSATIRLERAWVVGDPLVDGEGGFGRVYEGRAEDGSAVAIKVVPKDPGAARELLFDLPNVSGVMPILDKGEWSDNYVLVMPMAARSLRNFLKDAAGPTPIDKAIPVLLDIAKSLCELRKADVVHRDLKPDNVLLYKGNWCLADFGIARYAEKTTSPNTRKFSMTPPYAAPEQWLSERATNATDVYAFGVIAFEMVVGHLPFGGPEASDFRQQHLGTPPPSASGLPPSVTSFIQECLYKDAGSRPSPERIVERLSRIGGSASRAGQRLQTVNKAAVERQAEDQVRASSQNDRQRRRRRQFQDAVGSFGRISDTLTQRIREVAPSARVSVDRDETVVRLEQGSLGIVAVREARPDCLAAYDFEAPFDVIAFSAIAVKKPRDRHSYEGRSHSLWFCDAQSEGVYRWYELAFMVSPLIAQRFAFDPFQLLPTDPEAAKCLAPVMGARQVAWQPIPIDQGEEDSFLERWMDWFAAAADGTLSHPSHMPENSGGHYRFDQRRRRHSDS